MLLLLVVWVCEWYISSRVCSAFVLYDILCTFLMNPVSVVCLVTSERVFVLFMGL